MIARELQAEQNRYHHAGVRIHGADHACRQQDVDILVEQAGDRLAFLSLPEISKARDAGRVIDSIRKKCAQYGVSREIHIHVIIETPGGLRDVMAIGALPRVQAIAFG